MERNDKTTGDHSQLNQPKSDGDDTSSTSAASVRPEQGSTGRNESATNHGQPVSDTPMIHGTGTPASGQGPADSPHAGSGEGFPGSVPPGPFPPPVESVVTPPRHPQPPNYPSHADYHDGPGERPQYPASPGQVWGQPGTMRQPGQSPSQAVAPSPHAWRPGPPDSPDGASSKTGLGGWPRPLIAAVAVLIALVAGATGGIVGFIFADSLTPEASSPSQLMSDSMTMSDVAKAVQPSVVSIQTDKAEGSGVVYDDSGHIVTNNHVAASSSDGTLKVAFSDGRTVNGQVLALDPVGDLAIVTVEDTADLRPIKTGDSDALSVGDSVLAIGSPLGLEGSVSAGIVSALDRTIQAGDGESEATTLSGLIQTDAAINPGNSGGALVNGNGELVGINTAAATADGSEGSVGVGFAIPSAVVKDTADQLIDGGTVERAFFGVGVSDSTQVEGAVVTEVQPRSPAAEAGLAEGDVITVVGSTNVKAASDVVAVVREHKPGQKVNVTFIHNGDERTTEVTLATMPD